MKPRQPSVQCLDHGPFPPPLEDHALAETALAVANALGADVTLYVNRARLALAECARGKQKHQADSAGHKIRRAIPTL